MKTKSIFIVILTFCFSISFAQKKDKCNCPETELEIGGDTEYFEFKNGKKIILCGTVDETIEPKKYSEFVISVCGKTSIIDFWNQSKICKISVVNDTLSIKQLIDLPTAVNQKFQNEIWSREKIYFDGEKVMREFGINKLIRKYSTTEMNAVNKAYDLSKSAEMTEKKLELASKLFIGAISGSAVSRKHLKDFSNKFRVEGSEFEKHYNEIIQRLEAWDNQ